MNAPDNAYAQLSTEQLLRSLIGVRESRRLYRGCLQPLFAGSSEGGRSERRLAAARELVKRWLEEQLGRGCVLSQPGAVLD